MAKVNFQDPIEAFHGTLRKGGIINRRKYYRDDNGRIIGEGVPEAYVINHPRDWETTPATPNELHNQQLFRQAAQMSVQIRKDPQQLAQWQLRFQEHLNQSTASLPVNPRTKQPKRYHRLDAFIRATVLQQLKEQQA